MAGAVISALGELLARVLDSEAEVVERRRGEFEKHTGVENVTVRLGDGRVLQLFVKHLGSRRTDHPDQQLGDREARLYAGLLAEEGLPVPRCHGAAWDPASERGVLVLERLEAWPLHYHGLEAWFEAVRRLAELHARFAPLRKHDFLLRLDAAYMTDWAERAVAAVGGTYSAALARRLERLVRSWERVVEPIVVQPLTLVHNDLSRKNVLVARPGLPHRLCFVDWEMAGVGCGLFDLVHLRYQRLDPGTDRRLLDEYARALGGTGLLPAGRALRRLVAACELHRTVYRLARCPRWAKPLEYVADRVAFAERLWELSR